MKYLRIFGNPTLNAPERTARVAGLAEIPRGGDGPVFPAPWAARAFALAVALNKRGVFTWSEWADALGQELHRHGAPESADPQAYWRAWLAALEALLWEKQLADGTTLHDLQEAWRRAAEATRRGEPIALPTATFRPPPTQQTAPRRVR